MSTFKLYERLLDNEIAPRPCASEAAFYELWQEKALGKLSPIEQALAGGALASSLSWVFTAGYQATLQNAFSTQAIALMGWAAFAATEDKQEPEKHPGTTLTESNEGYRLNGYKSWVAHSKLVDSLIVTVNDPDGDKYKAIGVVLAASSAGVTLTHRDNPKFLNSLSQGFAHFDNTPVKSGQVIQFEPIRQFGRTEAKFVMLASVGFMLSQLKAHSEVKTSLSARLVCVGASLEALLGEEATSRKAYAAVDHEFQACADAFEREFDEAGVPNYAEDKRLLRMYSERIQRKAKRRRH